MKNNRNKNRNVNNIKGNFALTKGGSTIEALRDNQLTFKDAGMITTHINRAPVYPGTPYVDLGSATKMYNELTNFQPEDPISNVIANRPWYMDLGTINIDDSGADWSLDKTSNTLVPNSVAKQIEMKLGLVDAKIKNSMYTDLDILKVTPAVDTALSSNVRSNGAVYTRYLLGSKYNTFVLTKFWTDVQSVVSGVVLTAQNNKLLFDRANILINELKRARIRAALQSLEAASVMIMTDIATANNVVKNSGVMKIRPTLTAPVVQVQMSMDRDIYANKETWLAVKYNGGSDMIQLTLDIEPITSARTAIMNLLTQSDADWCKFVTSFGQEVMNAATNLTLSIADIQKPYQWLNTAIMQVGSEVFQDRFGFRKISLNIFDNCKVEVEPILQLSIFKNVNLDFETHNALAKTVTAKVPCNIECIPVDACKTNFVLALHDCEGEYKALIDISKFGLKEVLFWSGATTPTATKCAVLNGYIDVLKAKYVEMNWFGSPKFNMLTIGESGKAISSFAVYNMRKLFMELFPYFYLYHGSSNTYYLEQNTYGLVDVAYTPILDALLLNATANFGLK